MARKAGFRRAIALLVVSLSIVAFAAAPASAGPRITCVMNGQVVITPGGSGGWDWNVAALGPCINFLSGPYFVIVNGAGHSDSLGLCDGLVVTNLNIAMNLQILNIRTGQITNTTENWGSPITTFPVATPFLVSGAQSGLGVISTRILLGCPPGGSTVATIVFHTTT